MLGAYTQPSYITTGAYTTTFGTGPFEFKADPEAAAAFEKEEEDLVLE